VTVGIDFWPFGFVASVWLGPVIVAMRVLGFLLGLMFHLPRRLGANRRAKRAEKRAAELEARLATPPAVALPPALP